MEGYTCTDMPYTTEYSTSTATPEIFEALASVDVLLSSQARTIRELRRELAFKDAHLNITQTRLRSYEKELSMQRWINLLAHKRLIYPYTMLK